ncbi:MAG: AAA family ATPase [Candidatus Micrarchaeaceae archaeon]
MATAVEALPQSVLINPVVKNLVALATRAWKRRWIVTVESGTGIGKSTACQYAERALPFPNKRLEMKMITQPLDILLQIGLRPGQRWRTHGRRWMRTADLYYQAVEMAKESPYLLILDEADRLGPRCFEMLRDLWDDARLPILLAGNEVLTAKINAHHERLARRIRVRFEQRPLREPELRDVLECMGYKLTDEDFALLWKFAGGSPGFAEALLEDAQGIAESHNRALDQEAIYGAAKHFPTLKKAV